MKQVVITGIGAVTPLGTTFAETWRNALNSVSGLSLLPEHNTENLPWKMAGQVRGFDPGVYLKSKEIRRLDPFVHYAVAAAVMAARDAGFYSSDKDLIHPDKRLAEAGVFLGSSRGGISTLESAFRQLCSQKRSVSHMKRLSPFLMPATTISMAASQIAQKLRTKGYCLGISHACASGTAAIGEAFRLLKSGHPGPLFAGGAEAPLSRICIEGYGASRALSIGTDSSASRPFDRSRDGFVLAEGACVLVLEDAESARRRNAHIYAEISGYGNTTDGYHQTQPDYRGEASAIKACLDNAGLRAEDIQYISAHGTSTILGDRAEALAIREVFGPRASSIPVSALKSMTGHMLAASGALEIAITAMTIKEGLVPPTINLLQPDSDCNLRIITEQTAADISCAISNSFGFGGVNSVIALQKP